MKIVIHCLPNLRWHRRYFEYFKEGFRKHGLSVEASQERRKSDSDIAVLFGPNYWKTIERNHNRYLMVNRKFIGNVDDNVAVSWNGFNGGGRFCVSAVRPSRLRRHVFGIEPWRNIEDGHTLILGQFDLGRCGRYARVQEWYDYVKACTGDVIRIREWPGGPPMASDCRRARLAVSLNSTAAIETVLLGVPTVVMDENSPAWPICAHNLGHVHRSDSRLSWLEYLANCQWHFREIANGDFWRQLWPIHGPRLCDVEF